MTVQTLKCVCLKKRKSFDAHPIVFGIGLYDGKHCGNNEVWITHPKSIIVKGDDIFIEGFTGLHKVELNFEYQSEIEKSKFVRGVNALIAHQKKNKGTYMEVVGFSKGAFGVV